MPEDQFSSLPFLTRDMLKFGTIAKIEMVVTAWSNIATRIKIAGFTREGQFSYKMDLAAVAAPATQTFSLTDIPTMVGVNYDQFGAINQGDIYASVQLRINEDISYQLCAGYLGPYVGLSYPGALSNNINMVQGHLMYVYSDDPAAGAQISYNIPNYQQWRIIGGCITLVTDATVANRRLHLKIDHGVNQMLDFFCNYDQTASLTKKYTFAAVAGNLTSQDDNDVIIPIPPNLLLPAGAKFQTTITGGVAGDDLDLLRLWVEQFSKY